MSEIPKYPNTQVPKLAGRRFILGLWVFGCLGISLAGCGPSRPDTVKVTGKVTFNGGPPPAEGAIYFAPITTAEGYDKRPGRARFDTSGNFRATSFEDGDGLVPGTYSVRIECWKSPPTMDAPGNSHVPPEFSAPNLEVPTSGGAQSYDVDVPVATSSD